jgi:hypothetical protein
MPEQRHDRYACYVLGNNLSDAPFIAVIDGGDD